MLNSARFADRQASDGHHLHAEIQQYWRTNGKQLIGVRLECTPLVLALFMGL